MKLVNAIALSFLFLTQGMNIGMDSSKQIEHFSNFIAHYQVHKEYGGDSFYEYVVEELFSDTGDIEAHHNGSHEDKLPIHSHTECSHASVYVIIADDFVMHTDSYSEKKQGIYYQFQFNSRYLETLFQPPQALFSSLG